MPKLAEQIREALTMFARNDTEPALIGGLAVASHQVLRATKDVDFLLAVEAADARCWIWVIATPTPSALDGVALVREAGVPPQLPPASDPIAEWLKLMEVVQMLCLSWPVRDKPLQGSQWRL